MSAQSLQIGTFGFPNQDYYAHNNSQYRIDTTISFNHVWSFDIQTLSTTGISSGETINGLLFVPDLPSDSVCVNATAKYVPKNVTRLADIPELNVQPTALAPWISPECSRQYLDACRDANAGTLLFFLPGNSNNSTIPPPADDPTWNLGDSGDWKDKNRYPVYVLPSSIGTLLMAESAKYSQSPANVPSGDILGPIFGPHDYIRLVAALTTSGGTNLPSLWVFLLIVLGILLAVIGVTSLTMHFISRRRRASLQRRVAAGEVNLETLGIKRFTVPQETLDTLPLYTYGSGPAVANQATETPTVRAGKAPSVESSRPSSPSSTVQPAPALQRSNSYHPSPLSQPTCAICLDDFVTASEDSPGTTVRELPCHHIFHPECVDVFLRDNSSLCPLCKKTVLPPGFCPRRITNNMVRRERFIRRRQERYPGLDAEAEAAHTFTDLTYDERRDRPSSLPNIGSRIRTRTFSGLSQLRNAATGRRISSAPVMTEMQPTPPQPALMRSNTDASQRRQQPVQPPSTPGRREWARQRAIAMLGRQPTINDPDAEDGPPPSRWKKALRGVFPALGGRG